jgi:CheY-like chemotaxis protein
VNSDERVNILLVDDQPGKLLSYEAMLSDLGERLIRASSASEALEQLLRSEIAVVLIDVCMPELDGFELASMIRAHPRYQQTAIILVSAVLINDVYRLKGYHAGNPARQGRHLRGSVPQEPAARANERRAGAARRGSHRRVA